jgi:hypothetical protein
MRMGVALSLLILLNNVCITLHCPMCRELSVALWHSLHIRSFLIAADFLFLVKIALCVMCLKWAAASFWVRNLVAYLSATIAQPGVVCFMLSILLFHSLGAVGGVRLFLENSSVSCLTEILSRGDPISPSVYSFGRGNCTWVRLPPHWVVGLGVPLSCVANVLGGL